MSYHITVNLDKNEYIDPLSLGATGSDAAQLFNNTPSVAQAIILLLTDPDTSLLPESATRGRWHGDRIAVIGDKPDSEAVANGDYEHIEIMKLVAGGIIKDISEQVANDMGTLFEGEFVPTDSGRLKTLRRFEQ